MQQKKKTLRSNERLNNKQLENIEAVREALATLFLWWYGNYKPIRRVLNDGWRNRNTKTNPPEELPVFCVEKAWRERWFAKGELTVIVDQEISEKFGWLLGEPASLLRFTSNAPLWEKMATIILFDQVTRNARRGTPEA